MLHTLAALMPFAPGDPNPAPSPAATATGFLTNSATIDTDRILMVVLIILGAFVAVAGMRVTASKTRMSYGEMGQEGSQRFLGIALVAIGFSIPIVFALMRGGIGYFVAA